MQIALIGAGNLATSLGVALRAAGEQLVQVYSRTEKSAMDLADRLECPHTCRLEDVTTTADLYVVSVKDSVLTDVLDKLITPERAKALFVHTAGSIPLSVFEGRGAERYGVFYPMQTFSKARLSDFMEIPVFLECSQTEDFSRLYALADQLSRRVCYMSSEKRRYIHLAAVFACNFANHCYARAEQILEEQGIDFDVMWPLIDETASKIHAMPARKAQTGPAVRFDENVMKRHMELLTGNTEAQAEYELMSRGIHLLANP
ncbi:MAG: DUF2520 domain-containing protein [Clostridium sp.]|nr:DUF2520 domain-containing protein [Clostridium sp.]